MGLTRFLVLTLLVGSVCIAGCSRSTDSIGSDVANRNDGGAGDSLRQRTGSVTFEVNDGENTLAFEIKDVRDGETLEAVMRQINRVPISIHGSGVTAFVDGIGQRKTSGIEGWTFTIDGEFSSRGIGQTTLHPPTTITWTFASMSP